MVPKGLGVLHPRVRPPARARGSVGTGRTRPIVVRPGRVLGGGAGPPERLGGAPTPYWTGDLSRPPQPMSVGSDARLTSVRQGRRRAKGLTWDAWCARLLDFEG